MSTPDPHATPSSPQAPACDVAAIRARLEKAIPGPWRWEANLKSRSIELCGGRPRFDLTVMNFVRWGMGGAKPRFQTDGLMVGADKYTHPVPGREHHEDWFRGIAHPDADLIAHAPTDLAALLSAYDQRGREIDAVLDVLAKHTRGWNDRLTTGANLAELIDAMCQTQARADAERDALRAEVAALRQRKTCDHLDCPMPGCGELR
jgi:hypothetical protein